MSETELWSFDPGKARSIRATLRPSELNNFSELDLRWDDGKPVKFPVLLTDVDFQNLLDLVFDYAEKYGIRVTAPRQKQCLR